MPPGRSTTRPPKSAQRTPSPAQTPTTSPGALPNHVVRSTVPSPVTTRSAPSSRPRKPMRSRTRRAPSTSSAPSAASAAPRPPAAPDPGSSRNGARARLSRRRRSSSVAWAGVAPFWAAKIRAASRRGARTSHAARTGTRNAPSTSMSPAPPSTVAVPPRKTTISAGSASCTSARSSPSPRLDAPKGSRSLSATRPSPIACADSTSAEPSWSNQRAMIGRPSGSETVASRQSPPSVGASTSSVPSPPSATGSSTAPPSPSARAAAASRAERTPLRLAGHASAFTRRRRPELLDDRLLRFLVRHPAQRLEREPLAHEEDQPDAYADRHLQHLEAEPEGEPGRVGDPVRDERQRDDRLEQADVPRPEREDGRDVHQQQDDGRRRDRLVDAERRHHRPDGEQLNQPAGRLEHRSQRRSLRLAQDAARHQDRDEEERDADDGDQLQARDRPLRDPRRGEHEGGQEQRRDEIEETMREDGSQQPAGGSLAPGRPPGEDADPSELGDPPREHRVGQEADRERREHAGERRLLRAGQRLPDHDVPRDGADEHRREIQDEGEAHPAPGDGFEGVADEAPVGAAPPEQQEQRSDPRQDESRTREVTA